MTRTEAGFAAPFIISPVAGVRIMVPGQKQRVVMSVPEIPGPEAMVKLPTEAPKSSTAWVPPLFVSVTDVPPATDPVLAAVNPVTSIVSPWAKPSMTPGALAILVSNSHCADGANVNVPKLTYSDPNPLSVPFVAPDPSSSMLFAALPLRARRRARAHERARQPRDRR